MAATLPIFASCHFDCGINSKNHFPKEIFEIWLIIGDTKYIYITDIEIENNLLLADPQNAYLC